jgi:hypothetical protein
MIQRFRGQLTYANVMATMAVFIALGGSAWALSRNSVGSRQLKPNAVKTSDVADNAVTSPKVADGSLNGGDIDEATLGQVPSAASAPPTGPADGDLVGTYPSPKLNPPEPTHHLGDPGEPLLLNGWFNENPVTEPRAGFYVDPFGIVHLQGIIKRTAGSGTMFELPPAYRPNVNVVLAIHCTSGIEQVSVRPDGKVDPTGPFVNSCSLDGLTFRVGES